MALPFRDSKGERQPERVYHAVTLPPCRGQGGERSELDRLTHETGPAAIFRYSTTRLRPARLAS